MIKEPRAKHPVSRLLRLVLPQEVAELSGCRSALQPAVELIARRRAYRPHDIFVGSGRVMQYAGWFRGPRGLVEEVSLEEFTKGRIRRVGERTADPQKAAQVVRRARSRLGEQRYDLRNNCGHLCDRCHGAQPRSRQVEALSKVEYAFWRLLQRLQSQRLKRTPIQSGQPVMA